MFRSREKWNESKRERFIPLAPFFARPKHVHAHGNEALIAIIFLCYKIVLFYKRSSKSVVS